jgi:N-acetylmuramic acid 6-phosphate etherase
MSLASKLPPDRSSVPTEARHPISTELDALPTGQMVSLMIDDHRTVCEAVRKSTDALASLIDMIAHNMKQGGRLIYIGAGTSGRLGVLDASECPPTFQSDPRQVIGIIAGGDSALRASSEGKEDDINGAREALHAVSLTPADTVMGIAAGGTTPFVLGGIRIAKAKGAITALLTCARPKQPVVDCDHLMILETGPELLTGSTRLKAGSATKLALNIISTGVFVRLGKVYSNLMVDLRATNDKLTDRAIRILREFDSQLDRAEAHRLLVQAQGNLKAAIIMRKRSIDSTEAERILKRCRGNLRNALAENT